MVRTNSVGSIIQSTPGGPAFKKNYGTAYDDDSDVSWKNSKIYVCFQGFTQTNVCSL